MTPLDATRATSSDTEAGTVKKYASLLNPIRNGYAQIYFASTWKAAIPFIVATFIIPEQGLAGLLGLLMATLFAMLLGLPKDWIYSGYFAYNGLLQGLALGLMYEMNGAFFALLAVASFLGVGVASGLRLLFERYIGTPVLSLPFVITTWLMTAAAGRFGELIFTLEPFKVAESDGNLPIGIVFFAKSLGAAFFQLGIVSGLLVSLGVLLYSRHAFLLAIIGLVSGSAFHLALGGSFTDLNSMWVGFNFVLTAIAVGGMWVVPGIDSLILAALGAAACSVVTAASYQFLSPLGLPILAFPFVATTTIILFALKTRLEPKFLSLVIYPADTPEENLKRTKNMRARFVKLDVPSFALPVSGCWTITQGFNGEQTHRSDWVHAWDFEILGEDGKTYTGTGNSLSDFQAFQKPVFAPADGKVIKVVNHVEDNEIGQVNQSENWGNLVILWHYGSVYTSLCHLAKGSIAVEEGQTVHKGQRLGRVGNSGRSPAPHLHFQAQLSAEIGAPTIASELLNFLIKTDHGLEYNTHAVPQKNDCIQPINVEPSRFAAAGFPLGNRYVFRVTTGGQTEKETWETDIDFAGNRYLRCEETGASARIYVDKNVFMVLDYKGPREGGLAWLYRACPRIPLTQQDVYWHDKLPGEHLLSITGRLIYDFLEPAVSLAKLETFSHFGDEQSGMFTVETKLDFNGALADLTFNGINMTTTFDRRLGLVSLAAHKDGKLFFSMEQDDDHRE